MYTRKPIIVLTAGQSLATCEGDAQVVLTAPRAHEAGGGAVRKLLAQDLPAKFQPLRVSGSESIAVLPDFRERALLGCLDILVNDPGNLRLIISKTNAESYDTGYWSHWK
jgi:hypothetical protein